MIPVRRTIFSYIVADKVVVVDFGKLEHRWQREWEQKKVFLSSNRSNKPKYFNFDSAPFSNGRLHLGHARNYILGDIVARYKRLTGFNVLYTTNFDSFGLPNQLEAEKRSKAPKEYTKECISVMTRDLKRLGISYDWDRVNSTSDPGYYKWTQWLFLKLYSAGLVYRKEADVNWCNHCSTVLAHMEVENGKCMRCGGVVERTLMGQWFIALSKYSRELYQSMDRLSGWSDRAKNLVKGFIGKTHGVLVDFAVDGQNEILQVFIPEGRRLEDVTFVGAAANVQGGSAFTNETTQVNFDPLRRRVDANPRDRHGMDSGIKLVHPLFAVPIPVFYVDYLSDEVGPPVKAGTPASDREDDKFARKYRVPDVDKCRKAGKSSDVRSNAKSYYHVRDWMVSRQKQWGAPIPLIECPACGFLPQSEESLPIMSSTSRNDGLAPDIECPRCNKIARPVSDTLDCYIDDIWCFLSAELRSRPGFTLENGGELTWFPVDQYHAGYDIHMYLHLYRFLARFLYERGCLGTPEPIRTHFGHDMILQDGKKMSKRHQNATNIRVLMDAHGVDVVRIAVMLAGNPDRPIRWQDGYLTRARKIVLKLLDLVKRFVNLDQGTAGVSERRLSEAELHHLESISNGLVSAVTKYIDSYRMGTCIQHLEKYTKELYRLIRLFKGEIINGDDYCIARKYLLNLCVLYAPFAPHIAEQVWEQLQGELLVAQANWPERYP